MRYSIIIFFIVLFPTTIMAQKNKQFEKAEQYFYQERFQKSLRILQAILRRNPTHYKAYLLMADNYFHLKDKPKEEKALRKAVEVAPTQPKVYEQYGDFLRGYERLTEARDLYKKGIKQIPKNARLYYHLGAILNDLKDYDISNKILTKAIELNPKISTYFFIRAYTNKYLNKPKDALSDFDKSIELKPRDALGYSARADLKMEIKDYLGALEDIKTAEKLDSVDYKGFTDDYKEKIGLAYSHDAEQYEKTNPEKAIALAKESLKWPMKEPGKVWMKTFIEDLETTHGLSEFWHPIKERMDQARQLMKINKVQQAKDLLRKDFLMIMKTPHLIDGYYEEVFHPLYQKCLKMLKQQRD